MSDEQQATETPKRGRPRGPTSKPKPPPVRRDSVHRGPHYDDGYGERVENFEFTPFEATNPLSIDPDVVRSIRDEYGFVLMWVVHECAGKPFPDLVNARKRNGFAEVRAENFGGALRHMADKSGRIAKEGLVLMARPSQIEAKARAHDARMAKEAIDHMKASHASEGVPVAGGDHPSALSKNRHRQTFEPLKVPDSHGSDQR